MPTKIAIMTFLPRLYKYFKNTAMYLYAKSRKDGITLIGEQLSLIPFKFFGVRSIFIRNMQGKFHFIITTEREREREREREKERKRQKRREKCKCQEGKH